MVKSLISPMLIRFVSFKKAGGSILYLALRFVSFFAMPRQLLNPSERRSKTPAARRINNLITSETNSYLEIGMHNGGTFEQVLVDLKHGIEPYPQFTLKYLPANVKIFKIKSDEFFESYSHNTFYDFIFIDGSHEFRQVGKDLLNSLNHLSDNGRILMDDMVPCDSISGIADTKISKLKRQQAGLPGNPNHGDCFKLLPFIFEHLGFMQTYLILYPDNPQLLLIAPPKLREFFDMNKVLATFESYDFTKFTFETIFESSSLKQYPIYLEELLVNKLRIKN